MLPDIWKSGSVLMPAREEFIDRLFSGAPSFSGETAAWNPRTDITETDKEISVQVEVPGMNKDEIKVKVENNVLTISGERKQEKKEKKTDYSRVERYYGKFERSFAMPDAVLSDKISAVYKDGVLSVSIPKSEKAAQKQIAVEVK